MPLNTLSKLVYFCVNAAIAFAFSSCDFDTEPISELLIQPINSKDSMPVTDSIAAIADSLLSVNPALIQSVVNPLDTCEINSKPVIYHITSERERLHIPSMTYKLCLHLPYNKSRIQTKVFDISGFECNRGRDPNVVSDKSVKLIFGFDNDFWNMTDYYYTNGVYIAVQYPAKVFCSQRANKFWSLTKANIIKQYGLALVQNMYTGLKPKIDSIIPGDRPWASYTTFGMYTHNFYDHYKRCSFSQLSVGLLGAKSGGEFLQTLAHRLIPTNSPPKGWKHQIATDIIVDYQYQLKMLLYQKGSFESYAYGGLQIGSLRDNVQWGLGGSYGNITPFYVIKLDDPSQNKRMHVQLHFDVHTKLVAYDATLQGGVFNKSSLYVLNRKQLETFVVEAKAGCVLTYAAWQLHIEQFWTSKAFIGGNDHKYIRIRIGVGL